MSKTIKILITIALLIFIGSPEVHSENHWNKNQQSDRGILEYHLDKFIEAYPSAQYEWNAHNTLKIYNLSGSYSEGNVNFVIENLLQEYPQIFDILSNGIVPSESLNDHMISDLILNEIQTHNNITRYIYERVANSYPVFNKTVEFGFLEDKDSPDLQLTYIKIALKEDQNRAEYSIGTQNNLFNISLDSLEQLVSQALNLDASSDVALSIQKGYYSQDFQLSPCYKAEILRRTHQNNVEIENVYFSAVDLHIIEKVIPIKNQSLLFKVGIKKKNILNSTKNWKYVRDKNTSRLFRDINITDYENLSINYDIDPPIIKESDDFRFQIYTQNLNREWELIFEKSIPLPVSGRVINVSHAFDKDFLGQNIENLRLGWILNSTNDESDLQQSINNLYIYGSNMKREQTEIEDSTSKNTENTPESGIAPSVDKIYPLALYEDVNYGIIYQHTDEEKNLTVTLWGPSKVVENGKTRFNIQVQWDPPDDAYLEALGVDITAKIMEGDAYNSDDTLWNSDTDWTGDMYYWNIPRDTNLSAPYPQIVRESGDVYVYPDVDGQIGGTEIADDAGDNVEIFPVVEISYGVDKHANHSDESAHNSIPVFLDDDSENNDSLGTAEDISEGIYPSRILRRKQSDYHDLDYYRLNIPGDRNDADIRIDFDHNSADLDLYLLDYNGQVVESSTSTDNDYEAVSRSLILGLNYYVLVKVKDGSSNPYDHAFYDLNLSFSEEPPPTIQTDPNVVEVPEGGSATLKVRLSKFPNQNVEVSLLKTGDSSISINKSSLIFTPSNAVTYQNVTVSAAQDGDLIDGTANIQLSAPGLATKNVSVVENDDDKGLSFVSDLQGSVISVPENSSNSFNVKLSQEPPSDVQVNVFKSGGSDPDISIDSSTSFTIRKEDWSDWEEITLDAADDGDTINGTATIVIESTNLTYIPDLYISAHESDDDSVNFYCWSGAYIDEGDILELGVKLTHQPASNVYATVSKVGGDPGITIQSGASITFTPSNYGFHYVTYQSANDDDIVNGEAQFKVTASGLDTHYFSIIENDSEDRNNFQFVTDKASLTVLEGNTTSLQVKLNYKPNENIYATVYTNEADPSISVQSGNNLIFTPSNWFNYQTITLAAAEDLDLANGSATITIDDNGVKDLNEKDIPISEVDNDSQVFVSNSSSLSVPERGTNSFYIKLNYMPVSTVNVTISKLAGGDEDIGVQTEDLSFSPSDYNQYKSVAISASDDADTTNGQATIRVSATGIPDKDITVTEEDDDLDIPPPWTTKRLTWNSGDSFDADIVVDSSNDIHVVWHDNTPGNFEIYYKKSTDGGTTWFTKRLTNNNGGSFWPSIALDSSANMYVVWQDDTSGNNEIYFKKSTDGGNTWSDKRLTWNSGSSHWPNIAIDLSDNIHIVWYDDTPGNMEIFYRKSTNGGSSWSTKRLTWNSGGSYGPNIAVDSDGHIHIVWDDNTPGNYEIYYKKSTNGGTSWTTKRLTWNSGRSEEPTIAIDANNNIHTVWFDESPGNVEIFYKRSTNSGATWSTKRLTWNSGDSWTPVIATNSSNNIHVVWYDWTAGDSEIFYKTSTNGGSSWSTKRITWNSSWSWFADIATDSSNNPYIVWSDNGPGNQEIYIKK